MVRAVDEELRAGRHRTANKLPATTKALFAYAAPQHDLDKNPCETIGRQGVERPRDRVLPDDVPVAIWNAAGELGWSWGGFARTLLLTTQRRSEVSQYAGDVDLDEGVWSMSAEPTKSKRPRTVPLSEPVLAILRAAPRRANDDHVFWTGRRGGLTGYAQAKGELDRVSGVANRRFHDARQRAATSMIKLGVRARPGAQPRAG